MNNSNLTSRIIITFLRGRFSPEAEQDVQRWITEEENKSEKDQALRQYWENLPMRTDKSVYRSLNKVKYNLGFSQPARRSLLRPLLQVAAVIIPLLVVAGYFYFTRSVPVEEIIWAEIVVPAGQQNYIKLADGTEIWLNSGTTFRYPEVFGDGARNVNLSGEAFFKVAQDKQHPFIVDAGHLNIQVLGTEFNTQAYPDEAYESVILNEGSIMTVVNGKDSFLMNPGQQLIYDRASGTTQIHNIDAQHDNISGWMSGHLIFLDATLNDIFTTLERRYNIVIKVDKSMAGNNDKHRVQFINNESLDEVLNVISDISGGFLYHRDGNEILITAAANQ